MDFLLLLVPLLFVGVFLLVFALVFGVIGWQVLKGLGEWSRNNASPTESVPATVLAKRTDTSGGMNGRRVWTTYHIAFEMEDGDRREFWVDGEDYGVLAEGDRGTLTHQGTRFKGFRRE